MYRTAALIRLQNPGILVEGYLPIFLDIYPDCKDPKRYYNDVKNLIIDWETELDKLARRIEEQDKREFELHKKLEVYETKERLERQLKDTQKQIDSMEL